MGASHAFNRKETDDLVGRIREITRGGARYAIDTGDVSDLVKEALACARVVGTAVVLGVTSDLTINVQQELVCEARSLIDIDEGDAVPKHFIPASYCVKGIIAYYEAGKFPFDKIAKFYDFKDPNQAFGDSHKGKVIKPVSKMV